jgi:hypothetical protein
MAMHGDRNIGQHCGRPLASVPGSDRAIAADAARSWCAVTRHRSAATVLTDTLDEEDRDGLGE